MDSAFFHPKIVHLPLALAFLMPLVAGGLALAWSRGWLPARAFVVAVALQAVLVASGWGAMASGEDEEERVEQVVAHSLIHEHEEAAEGFLWSGGIVLVILGAAFGLRERRWALSLAAAGIIGTVVTAGLAVRTGELGGALVYRHGAAEAYTGDLGATGEGDSESERH